jgi:hypothetical protein
MRMPLPRTAARCIQSLIFARFCETSSGRKITAMRNGRTERRCMTLTAARRAQGIHQFIAHDHDACWCRNGETIFRKRKAVSCDCRRRMNANPHYGRGPCYGTKTRRAVSQRRARTKSNASNFALCEGGLRSESYPIGSRSRQVAAPGSATLSRAHRAYRKRATAPEEYKCLFRFRSRPRRLHRTSLI